MSAGRTDDQVRSAGRVSPAVLVVALLAACIAFQLNASMLSPALATIEKELDVSTAEVGLTQTAFFTAAALFSLFLPRLGDMIGRRKVLVGMLAVMAVGCVVAALSPNIELLFVGRILQGVSGPVVPLCLVMLRHEITDNAVYGTLMGVVTAVNGGVAGIDALAGGYLAQNHGFHSVFWAMAVVAALASALVLFLAPESASNQGERMDWTGVGLLVVAVGAALLAVNELGKLGAANWGFVAMTSVVAVAGFAAFWWAEGRSTHPLIQPSRMRERAVWALLLTTALTMTGVFAVMNGIVPGLAQDKVVGPGLSAEGSAWWTLTPYAIAGLLIGPFSGRFAARSGYLRILRIGLLGTAVGLAALAFSVGGIQPWLLLVLSVFIGLTYAGTVNIVLNGLGVVLSPKEAPGVLPGLNAGAFNLGAGISFAVLLAVQTAVGSSRPGSSAGYVAGIVTGLVVVGLALGASMLVPRPPDDVGADAERPLTVAGH